MSLKHDETNVFKIPHGRMMQLVNTCNSKLIHTDFANNDALFVLLTNLQGYFNEFKSHEEIENEFIMKKLKSKLKSMSIHNSAVCNCHTEDEFTPLFNLVDLGYLHVNKTKTPSQKINFGIKLREAINQFAKNFVPHMKEEEDVFQPLLMKYFDEKELIEMKILVLKSHLKQRKAQGASFESSNNTNSDSTSTSSINDMPNEILLKCFSYLNNSDLLKGAQVSSRWNELVYNTKSNWLDLDFSTWINQNNFKSSYDEDNIEFEKRTFGFKDIEYIDDSDEEYENESEIQEQEVKLFHFWIKKLLPRIGPNLKSLKITNCKSLNNNLARRILQLCSNLKSIDLSYTNIGDNSFRGVKLNKLEELNCEGCDKLSDKAFKYLFQDHYIKKTLNINSQTNIITKSHYNSVIKSSSIEEICSSTDIKDNTYNNTSTDNIPSPSTSLKSINLSGCYSVTDNGLEYIALIYDLKKLEYLNLSGCLNVSSTGMHLIVEEANELDGENLYYCDNIDDGPLQHTANGCANLECPKKYCCRNGL